MFTHEYVYLVKTILPLRSCLEILILPRKVQRPKIFLRDGQSIVAAKNLTCACRVAESGNPRAPAPQKNSPGIYFI